MRRFAELLERLAFTPSRNAKLRLITDYLRTTPDPDRGWGLAAITRDVDLRRVKPAMLRALTDARVDPELFALSYDFVGDLAETIALIWPAAGPPDDPALGEVVARLHATSRREAPQVVERLLDRLDASGRFALLKLVTGGLRVGVSARLAKQALADLGARDVTEIEELWHGLAPPYAPLFAWLTGHGPRPLSAALAPFRPVMLSHAIEAADFDRLDPADFAAEWKWDGIRVQAVADGDRPPPLLPHRRRHLRRLPRPPRRPRLRRRHRRRAPRPHRGRRHRPLLRAPAAPQPQDRHARPPPPLPRPPPRLRPPPPRRGRPPPPPLHRTPRRARNPRRHPRPRPLRPLPPPPLRHLGGPRRASAPPRPTR